ncbi:MAG TPA: hypothetical protein PLT13_12305 [Spirochaetota bacterium]|nr:hypothetical protein [Spirochaetota bacterium]
MKKILILFIILIALPLASNLKDSEKNESEIKGLILNIKFTVKNDRGSAEHSGKMYINNYNQIRYDQIIPQRCSFIINNGFYQYYDYKEKKKFKSKISEMSFDHQVIVDQIFNFEIIYPIEYLKRKFFFPTDNSGETLWGLAKNSEESRVKITFADQTIKQIDFLNNNTVTKKVTFTDYNHDHQIYFPRKVKIEILKEPYFTIDYSISSIKYSQNVLKRINESL